MAIFVRVCLEVCFFPVFLSQTVAGYTKLHDKMTVEQLFLCYVYVCVCVCVCAVKSSKEN